MENIKSNEDITDVMTEIQTGEYSNLYIIEYTKVCPYPNGTRVKEKHYYQTLHDVFEVLRFSKFCSRELGLSFDGIGYTEETIDPKSKKGRVRIYHNEDISFRPMTDEEYGTQLL